MSKKQKLDLNDFLTSPLRDEETTSIISNLFNRFFSEENSIRVNGQIGKIVDQGAAVIAASDFDREQNALVPALHFKTGAEETIFGFDDLINKLASLGVNTNDLRSMLVERYFNFAPPINFDKFINFANYYWIGANQTTAAWNTNSVPEYYVIEPPLETSTIKLPVRCATTRDIKLYGKDRSREQLVLNFNGDETFTLTGNKGPLLVKINNGTFVDSADSHAYSDVTDISVFAPDFSSVDANGYGMSDVDTAPDLLFSFKLTNGTTPFAAGDQIYIEIEYISGSNILFNELSLPVAGKGYVSNVLADNSLMLIDEVQLEIGDDVLVWNQNATSENGIYRVTSSGKWIRRPGSDTEQTLPLQSTVFVREGTQANSTFILNARADADTFVLDDVSTGGLEFELLSTVLPPQVNDWQVFNYWVHVEELRNLPSAVQATAVQATCPIIEYRHFVQMNAAATNDIPIEFDDGPVSQTKQRINQLPQFDLYRYDGTHAGKTSSIFYYVEDPDYPVDVKLQRRVKTTINSDYIFGVGLSDEFDRTLFFKNTSTGIVQSIWTPGPIVPEVGEIKFAAALNADEKDGVNLVFLDVVETQQITLQCVSATEFSVNGTRSGFLGTATVDIEFDAPDFSLTVLSGSVPYDIGDSFTFVTRGPVAPRYVTKDENGVILNSDPVNEDGTWLVPRRMFENLTRGQPSSLTFGNLIDHGRSVIKAQDGLVGASFGTNNFRTLSADLGLGGLIREHSSNFPLLLSNLMQRDISPIAILDFAEQQQTLAVSSIDQFISNELANFIASTDSMQIGQALDATAPSIIALLAKYEELRANDTLLRTVYQDSSANVINWPVSLAMIGATAATSPFVTFDKQLNFAVLVHHDGHLSALAGTDVGFSRKLALTLVGRSDGTTTAGTIGTSPPVNPYARQLWFNSANGSLNVFDVISDAATPPTATNGFWFNRQTSTLYEYVGDAWQEVVTDRWQPIDPANIRNSLMLAVEKKLFAGIHQDLIQKVNLESVSSDAESEFAKFAAKYNYDLYAPDYKSADAFTWNYSSIAPASPARWHKVYEAHFDVPGVSLPTSRPDLEPWKLLNIADKPPTWDAQYADVTGTRMWNDAMWADIIAALPVGFKVAVDITTDTLLPPYVAPSATGAEHALINSIPAGTSNGYSFGQWGPVETVWRKSLEYKYGLARQYFKKHPLEFLDKLWGETYFTVENDSVRLERNLMRPLPAAKFLLHGEKLNLILQREVNDCIAGNFSIAAGDTVEFVISHVEDNQTSAYVYVNGDITGSVMVSTPFTFTIGDTTFDFAVLIDRGLPYSLGDRLVLSPNSGEFIPSSTKKLLGLGQIFTNLFRHNLIDTDLSEAINAYRGWDVKLMHRIGALIRDDTLVIDAASMKSIPDTAFRVMLKQSLHTESKWISALRVQLIQVGSKILSKSGYIPQTTADDWVFRIETYNPQHPSIEYYELDATGAFQTFHALNKQSTPLAFKRYTERVSLQTVSSPLVITGLQNTLNVLFGYIDRLEELGWSVNAGERIMTDAETGRNLDWQLEVEKLVDRLYRQMRPGEGHIMNPFMNGLWLHTPRGLMSKYSDKQFLDFASSQSVFDVNGSVIPAKSVQVIRTDEKTGTYSDTPIFSAHVFIDEFEHVILFNNAVSDEADSVTLFDPFLGLRISSAVLSMTRQDSQARKPHFDGYVLSGNKMRRNITSSIDAIANYYDSTKTFNEPTTASHALALLGFNSKSYFDNIGAHDATQFNFWRGLIQAKGTNMSIDAFANFKKFANASVDEYWAYKVANYGDSRQRNFPEIKINVADALQKFTQLQFFDASYEDYTALPMFTQIEQNDDSRWFSLDDLGMNVSFAANAIEVVVDDVTNGYYQLSDIFHNGDSAAPFVFVRHVTTNPLNGAVAMTESITSTAVMVTANLLHVTNAITSSDPNTKVQYVVKGYTWANSSKVSPVKLFNYSANTLEKEISTWHPAIGIHAVDAMEIVHTISSRNPALVNSTLKTTNNPNFSMIKPWGKREVGRVWWDTSNLGYIPYYDATIFPDRSERHARWGNLAEWSSIDLYEWVESDVHPDQYDALASEEEGQADIPASQRSSGKAALKSFYSRNRIISIRPIAWSRTGRGDSSAHPAFASSSVKMWVGGSALFADTGRVADSGLVAGNHFSGWSNNKPVGEVIIDDQLAYVIGSTVALGAPEIIASGNLASISVRAIQNGKLGLFVGKLTVTSRLVQITPSLFIQKLRMSDQFGSSEDVTISDWPVNDQDAVIQFTDFGVELVVSAIDSSFYTATDIAGDIVASFVDVVIREGAAFTDKIALPDTVFINDSEDPDFLTTDYEWRAWKVPSQTELSSDLVFPKNRYSPYMGDLVEIEATPEVIADMKVANLVLKNGISIARYKSEWTEWTKLENRKDEKFSTGAAIIFARSDFLTQSEEIDANLISVYINGIQVSPKNYVIQGDSGFEEIVLLNSPAEGAVVLLIYRAKPPTDEQLAFDSTVEDDPSIQVEYKAGYQYTQIDQRNEVGAIVGAKYYFWVQDSTIVRTPRSLSLQQAKSLLTFGPSQFVAFAKLDPLKNAFDSCIIAGLNSFVTNNDTYKLRFANNETLRDDPEQLSLKNVHTEWALMKRTQNSKIPVSLWQKLTDAAAGEDLGGTPLPSYVRSEYDSRNGTRTSYGFGVGQILADTKLVRATIQHTILNTALEIRVGSTVVTDYITSLDLAHPEEWFKDAASARTTMDLIWSTARARQINEIFFAVLEDALANNYEFSDIFKTSFISVNSTSVINAQNEVELEDGKF